MEMKTSISFALTGRLETMMRISEADCCQRCD